MMDDLQYLFAQPGSCIPHQLMALMGETPVWDTPLPLEVIMVASKLEMLPTNQPRRDSA